MARRMDLTVSRTMMRRMPRQSMMADKALAAVLRQLRERKGLSQESVAYQAGVTTGSLARIELGQSSPAWVTVRRVAAALGVTLVELAEAVERSA
jgi:transcriptional regulator with XRE-family HTH domain